MGNISVSLPSDGTTADVADYNTPITTIVNAINGNLDNSNLVSGAAIATDRIADNAITTNKIANSNITSDKIATDSHIISYVETGTGQSTASTSLIDATSMTVTFTTPASCTKVMLRAEATISSDTAGATFTLAITNSSNTIQVQRKDQITSSNVNALQTLLVSRRISVTASTSYTFKLRFSISGGTCVLNQGGNADSPTILWVERA